MGARVLVLGTAQDGGVPHAGCACATCEGARHDASLRRRVACIAVVGESGRALLVDATPDLPDQVADLAAALDRPPPALDALLVTHAHVGHYLGLAFLGREAMNVRDVPLFGTERMASFLAGNRPWAHLLDRGHLRVERIAPGASFAFDGLELLPFASPHRAEDTDTLGLEVRGPTRRLLYLPDADHLPPDIVARIREADVALVDGTFHDPDELPGRDLAEIPHPFVVDSVPRLAGGRGEVLFTHLNHSNRLLHPDPALRTSLPHGLGVLSENQVFTL